MGAFGTNFRPVLAGRYGESGQKNHRTSAPEDNYYNNCECWGSMAKDKLD